MQIKKIMATGLTAVMAGATLAAGALAATPLSSYPTFLGNNGQVDAFVVVGADAQPADIVGAGDVVAGLSALSYTMTSGTTATVVTEGGKTEDMDIGTRLNASTAFTSTIDDSDIPSFFDDQVSISIGGVSDTYDAHEEIRLGTTDATSISIETGLTASSPDEDFTDAIFLQALTGSVKYKYVFDEALSAGNYINDSTDNDPIILNFMGRELRITDASSNSITVDTGERFVLKAGESATTSDGKTVTLVQTTSSSSSDKAQVTVNGDSAVVNEDSVRNLGSTEIKVSDVIDSDGIEFDTATVIVGTAATGGEASDTFSDGDEYVIPCGTLWHTDGCDNDDPDWVWSLSGLTGTTPVIDVSFNERIDSTDDNPPMVGDDENHVLDLPGGFAWISLDKAATNDYQDYEITDRIKDLRDSTGNNIVTSGAHVIEFSGEGNDDSFTLTEPVSSTTKSTDNIYVQLTTGEAARLFWEDSNDGNKLRNFANISTNGTTASAFNIDYQSASIPVDIEALLQAGQSNFNITVNGEVGSDVKFFIQETGANSGAIDYVGHSDSDTTQTNDVLYGTRDISGWEENTMTPDGLKIFNPDSNAPSDKYKMSVPSEFGSNDFQVFVTIGGSGTSSTSSSGGKTLVPITTSITKLDTEIGAAEKAKNLVLVGGPAVNRLTAEAMGLAYPAYGSASGITEGTAMISVISDAFTTGKAAVIVAGYEAENTRLATSVLQQAATKLAGVSASSVTVTGASVASAQIVAA
ncbi:MAG: S-layer protein [Candidatus Aenigmarchaeota archaeon]|nr:S-layer protein [Candidatus Aenigmarchaeota archaeon]